MAEIVNLNRFRKAKARAEEEKRAKASRARFGRRKGERQGNDQARCGAERELDGKKLEKPDEPA